MITTSNTKVASATGYRGRHKYREGLANQSET